MHYSLCIAHCALLTVHYSLCKLTVHHSLCITHCANSLCIAHCALLTVHHSLCIAHCALLTVQKIFCKFSENFFGTMSAVFRITNVWPSSNSPKQASGHRPICWLALSQKMILCFCPTASFSNAATIGLVNRCIVKTLFSSSITPGDRLVPFDVKATNGHVNGSELKFQRSCIAVRLSRH